MSDITPGPDHRADDPEFLPALVSYETTADPAPEFLPLAVRRVLYVVGLLGTVAAPILAVTNPEYSVAIVSASGLLNAAALGTALANPPR